MDTLLKWLEPPIHLFMWIGLFAGFLLMAHVTVHVTGLAFDRPPIGTTEIASGYYMVAIAYLPWAWIASNDNHISVELFTRRIPEHVMEWIELGIKLLTAAYVALFTWQTWLRALQQMERGEALEVGGNYLDVWPSRFFLPVAGGMMVIYLVVRVARDLRDKINARG